MNKYYPESLKVLFPALEKKFIEREELIRLLVLTVLAGEHIFLYGNPGTGKSYISRVLSNIIEGSNFFEYLINENVKYEDFFGGERFDEEGRPNMKSVLNANFFFADEVFKCGQNTAIVNAFLQMMAERKYSDGFRDISVPLITMIGASNEFPDTSKLNAFFDRFLIRYDVQRIKKPENRKKFIDGDFDTSFDLPVSYTFEDLAEIKEESKKVKVPDKISNLLVFLEDKFVASRLPMSTRRIGWAVRYMKTAAFLNGRDAIDYSDLFLLMHLSWDNENQKAVVYENFPSFIYGRSDTVISFLDEIKIGIEKLSGFQEHYSGFLSHQETIENFEKEKIFKQIRTELKSMLEEYDSLLTALSELKFNYEFNKNVAEQVQANLFLNGPFPKTFSNHSLSRLDSLYLEVKKKVRKINTFLRDCESYSRYEVKALEKSNQKKEQIA